MALMSATTAIGEFQEVRESNKYYVDKTLLIKDILMRDERGAYLFVRPRRFGKSMNLSMMDAFFNIRYEGNHWFDGLAISEHHEFDCYRNAFPVIRLDFSNVSVDSWDSFIKGMYASVWRAYTSYVDISEEDVPQKYRFFYQKIINGDRNEIVLEVSLTMLAAILRSKYGRRAIVLIDEYDHPITDAIGTDLHGRISSFMRSIYTTLIKGCGDVQMSYVTGTTKIIHHGFYSGLNNMSVDDTFSTTFDERFGFTESEVRSMLGYYGVPEKFDEVREWYDGYRFGDADVYNPFSMMSYVANGFRPSKYWVKTTKNSILRWVLERIDINRVVEMSQLFAGGSVDVKLVGTPVIDKESPKSWYLFYTLVEMGYLKMVPVGDSIHRLSVPNKEVMAQIEEEVSIETGLTHEVVDSLVNALVSMDDVAMEDSMDIILNDHSFFNMTDERYYAAVLVTAIRSLTGRYNIFSEFENGNGRVDIFLLPKTEGTEPIIIEIKRVDDEDRMEDAMGRAFDQIDERRYYQGIRGDVTMVGMVFCGKVSMVRSHRAHVGRCDEVGPSEGP